MGCSSWAATVSSRSTRSSAGTATSERSVCSRARSWPDGPLRPRPEPRRSRHDSSLGETTVIYLETPKKLRGFIEQAHGIAVNVFRPISRKYDSLEHTYPKELDILAAIIDGVNAGGASRASAAQLAKDDSPAEASTGKTKNGGNLATVLA